MEKFTDLKSIPSSNKRDQTWSPNMSEQKRENYLISWNKAIEKAKNWL